MQEDSGVRTRDRVLLLLKTRGPQTAAELAGRLGVTAMAVRQHLAALESEALVSFEDERRSVGRPARVWRLSSAASARFPDSHADLTVDLLSVIREAYGDSALEAGAKRDPGERGDCREVATLGSVESEGG